MICVMECEENRFELEGECLSYCGELYEDIKTNPPSCTTKCYGEN